jgi:hypothetical protein
LREKITFEKTRVGFGYETSTLFYFNIKKEGSQYINMEEVNEK